MKHKVIPPNVFDAKVHFLIGRAKDVNQYATQRWEGVGVDDNCIGRYQRWTPDDPKEYTEHFVLVATDRARDRLERQQILVHEIVHCATGVLTQKGVKIGEHEDESLAYFCDWLYKHSISLV